MGENRGKGKSDVGCILAEMWASASRLDVTMHSKESPPLKLSNSKNEIVNMQS